jgi:hypothetical protein
MKSFYNDYINHISDILDKKPTKKISISIKFPDGMRITKSGISLTELKHLIERLEVV